MDQSRQDQIYIYVKSVARRSDVDNAAARIWGASTQLDKQEKGMVLILDNRSARKAQSLLFDMFKSCD